MKLDVDFSALDRQVEKMTHEEQGEALFAKMEAFFAANPEASAVAFDAEGNAYDPGLVITFAEAKDGDF